MSPLYTEEERQIIGSCRETIRMSRDNPREFALYTHAISAQETLRSLGTRAALRSWRRKAAAAYTRGLTDAAGIVRALPDICKGYEDGLADAEAAIRRAAGGEK